MLEHDVRAALARIGVAPTSIEEVPGGWANFTFDLDGEQIVRFPRTDSVALATQRELQLLPALHGALGYRVPEPSHVSQWNERPFFVYRRIEGRPAEPEDVDDAFVASAAAALAQLHSFPVEHAAQLLHVGPPDRVWSNRHEDLWPSIEATALPEMGADLGDRVKRQFAAIVEDPPEFEPCLVHNDLGLGHYLLDEDTQRIVGIIDFEDATVGDPAVDFVPLIAVAGHDALGDLTAGRDLGSRLEERLHFYRWLGSVYAIIYGVTTGDDEERRDGISELRRRITAPVQARRPSQ